MYIRLTNAANAENKVFCDVTNIESKAVSKNTTLVSTYDLIADIYIDILQSKNFIIKYIFGNSGKID